MVLPGEDEDTKGMETEERDSIVGKVYSKWVCFPQIAASPAPSHAGPRPEIRAVFSRAWQQPLISSP